MEQAKITFGRRLRKIRKARKLTLEKLGQLSSIGYKHIADIERGLKIPSFDAIDRLAAALEVPVFQFFLIDDGKSDAIDVEFQKIFQDVLENSEPTVKQSLVDLLAALRRIETSVTGSDKKTQP